MIFQVFLVSYVVSLLGTIPPATINVTVMQLSLKKKAKSALSLSLGAAIVDTTYAGIAVTIQEFLANQIEITNYFYLLAALVLITLGILSLIIKPATVDVKIDDNQQLGFIKGVLLGLFNPLAMPFWLGVTSYLKLHGLIDLDGINYWSYVLGVFLGELTLLGGIVKIGKRFQRVSGNRTIVNVIPGIAFLILGTVNLIQWLWFYVE